jgi:hypothetical protein
MDSSDGKRPSGSGFQLVWFVRQFQHFISNCVIMGESSCVGGNEALINQLLATALELLEICDKRNVQDHISAKGQTSWGCFQRTVVCATSCINCICNCSVYQLFGIANTWRRIQSGKNSECVANCLMHAFANRVCLWILGSDRSASDIVNLQCGYLDNQVFSKCMAT